MQRAVGNTRTGLICLRSCHFQNFCHVHGHDDLQQGLKWAEMMRTGYQGTLINKEINMTGRFIHNVTLFIFCVLQPLLLAADAIQIPTLQISNVAPPPRPHAK